MSGFVDVMTRELTMRRTFWWAALAAGLLPFLLAVLPGSPFSPGEVRSASALGISACFGLLVALVLGASVIGRDLSEGRLSFDFTRPAGSLSIWAGRMAAALLLALGTALVAVLPATMAGGGPVKLLATSLIQGSSGGMIPAFSAFWSTGLYLFSLLYLVALAHAVSVMVRSHSLWLLVDLVCGLALFAALFLTGRFLYAQGALMAIAYGACIAIGSVLVALLVAGAVQVCKGRTDLKAGHRILSITLWSLCALGALSVAAYANWYARVSPADLAAVYGGQAEPGGRWVYLGGPLEHRSAQFRPAFLYNPKTGSYLRLGVSSWGLTFSADGYRCVWLEGWKKPELYTADLTKRQPTAIPTDITLPLRYNRLALSPKGDRCAIASRSGISVYDLLSGKQLVSARLSDSTSPTPGASGAFARVRFASKDKVLFYTVSTDPDNKNESDVTIRSLDVGHKRLTTTGRIEHVTGYVHVLPDSSGTRFVLATYKARTFTMSLHDGTSGALVAALAPAGRTLSAAFLPDGRIAVAGSLDGDGNVWVFGSDGALKASIRLPVKGSLVLGAEPSPDRLLVTGPLKGRDWYKHASLYEVDVAGGTARLVAQDLRPLSVNWWFGAATLPKGEAARLCMTRSGSLVSVDPSTGRKTMLIRGHAAGK